MPARTPSPSHGTTRVSGTTITYTTRTAGFAGTDTFNYTVTDGRGGSATATVTVTVIQTTCDATSPAIMGVTGTNTTQLIDDCNTLLKLKGTLLGTEAGARALNWAVETSMEDWAGITIGDSAGQQRVTVLNLTGDPQNNELLTGSLPAELGQLAALRILRLTDNHLTGPIPAQLGQLAELVELSLDGNALTGRIPAQLDRLAKLTELWLGSNALTGSIPAQLGSLAKLYLLDIQDNHLTGSIPAQLGSLSDLTHLWLHDNPELGGTLQPLTGLTNLEEVRLNHTSLGGSLPDLSDLTYLNILNVSHTKLTGVMPATWSALTVLNELDLSATALSGAIPAELGDLAGLTRLSLHDTHWEGEWPAAVPPALWARADVNPSGNSTLTLRTNRRPQAALRMRHTLEPGVPFTYTVPAFTDRDGDTLAYGATLEDGNALPSWLTFDAASRTLSGTPPAASDIPIQVTLRATDAAGGSLSLCDSDIDLNAATSGMPPSKPALCGTVTLTLGPSGGGGGGGGGGSPQSRADEHGNTAGQATPVGLDEAAPWASSTPGQINPADDEDYFRLTLPHAGVLVVETSGSTDTVGTVWQEGEELGTAASGGAGQNFRLSVPVAAGPVVIAVTGNGTGAYTLETRLLVGYLENPGDASFQSGIGVLSGWVCEAETVEIELNGAPQVAAYGTERLDTEPICGDTDNGFGLLFNWNLLGDGAHTVVAWVDGIELGRATVTVTTLGQEFLQGAEGECVAADFPSPGETATLAWQQTSQNFVLVDGGAPTAATSSGTAGVGYLENPGANSFQSGIGVLSGWVCAAERVEIEINGTPQPAAYGTERLDTAGVCGDTDNGFGLLFNWNLLGEGEHEIVAFVDDVELGRAVVQVTTLGEEFVRDVTGECVVEDFPLPGETVMLEWQQTQQNFVITGVE